MASHFATRMAALEPLVRVVYDNAQPLSPQPDPRTTEWARFAFRPGLDAGAALGGLMYRGTGTAQVQVFTPLGRGQGSNLRIQRSIQTLFRDESISGVRVEGITLSQIGEMDGWYMGSVSIRFETDEMTI